MTSLGKKKVYLGFSGRLAAFVLGASAIANMSACIGAYQYMKGSETKKSLDIAQSISQSKQEATLAFFEKTKETVLSLATARMSISALKDFKGAYDDLGKDAKNYIQTHYINKNPFSTGERENYDVANDGSIYTAYHQQYHRSFSQFNNSFKLYDLFLIDKDSNILYTVEKEEEIGVNLNQELTDSGLAKVVKKVQADPKRNVWFISDFSPYAPSEGAYASFIAAPVFTITNEYVGVIAAQIATSEINDIITKPSENYPHLVSYLIGEDMFARSDLNTTDQTDIGVKSFADNKAATLAVAGQSGSLFDNGQFVGYSPFKFGNLNWGINTIIPEEEAYGNLYELRGMLTTVSLIVLGVISVISYFVMLHMVKPVLNVTKAVKAMSEGKSMSLSEIKRSDEIGELARAAAGIYENAIQAAKVKTAVDISQNGVMIADDNLEINYINKALQNIIQESHSFFKKIDRDIDHSNIVGQSIDIFFGHNSEEMREKILKINAPYSTDLIILDRHFSLIIFPVNDIDGKRIGYATEWCEITNDVRMRTEFGSLLDAMSQGDFSKRLDITEDETVINSIAMKMNKTSERVEKFMDALKATLSHLADGYLNVSITKEFGGEFNALKNFVNTTISRFSETIVNVKNSSSLLVTQGQAIADNSETLASRAEDQAASIQQTSATMDELSCTVKQNAESAQGVNSLSKRAALKAQEGGAVVSQAIDSMKTLKKSSARITDIVNVIDSIAFQTNLLALNAAVEAARAGEAGKGFSVVASEVRVLAQRSAGAANEISNLITNANDHVKEGVEYVLATGTALDDIVKAIQSVERSMNDISVASQEQSTGINEVSTAVASMDDNTQMTASIADQCASSARSVHREIEQLKEKIGFFKTSGVAPELPASSLSSTLSALKKEDESNMRDVLDTVKTQSDMSQNEEDEEEFQGLMQKTSNNWNNF
ncbi:MAG: methyl-accepting chemotaxis protein [Pseudomonadota bacterium]